MILFTQNDLIEAADSAKQHGAQLIFKSMIF